MQVAGTCTAAGFHGALQELAAELAALRVFGASGTLNPQSLEALKICRSAGGKQAGLPWLLWKVHDEEQGSDHKELHRSWLL